MTATAWGVLFLVWILAAVPLVIPDRKIPDAYNWAWIAGLALLILAHEIA